MVTIFLVIFGYVFELLIFISTNYCTVKNKITFYQDEHKKKMTWSSILLFLMHFDSLVIIRRMRIYLIVCPFYYHFIVIKSTGILLYMCSMFIQQLSVQFHFTVKFLLCIHTESFKDILQQSTHYLTKITKDNKTAKLSGVFSRQPPQETFRIGLK